MTTTPRVLGALAALCLMMMAPACDGAKKDAKPDDAKAATKAADTKDAKADDVEAEVKADDAKAADAKAGDAKAAEGDGEPPPTIGVAECDEYITKMTKCFAGDSIPAEARETHRMGFDMSVKSWADSATAHPESLSNLVPGCKAAIDAARKTYPDCFKE